MIFWMITLNIFGTELNDLKIALSNPAPVDKRFKLISGNWILSNGFREREIKNKLFSCKTRLIACDKYKALAKDFKPEIKTYLLKNQSWTIAGMAISFSAGLAVGLILIKK